MGINTPEDHDGRCTGTEGCDCDDCYAYDPELHDCFHCGGDGWRECDDPIQCTYEHNKWGECRCPSCGGSGAAKDMTIW